LAARDPRTPWYAKALAFGIAAYALVPDFIPVAGYLDEVILLPLAIMLAVRLVPAEVLAEHRATAAAANGRPISRFAAVFVVTVWVLVAAAIIWWFWPDAAR
jgi:uncharacterized membrane protein YkvA (DUF1232 family)